MAILIDPPAWPAHGTLFSHLVSDESYEELHAFARRLHIPRRAFDLDHYDVPASLHAQAVSLGAQAVSAKDVVHALRDSGLRVRQVDREAARPARRREYLRAEWVRLGEACRASVVGDWRASAARPVLEIADDAWLELGDELLARWGEPHRSYHDERHLEEVLLALDQFEARGATLLPATLLAAWFHDAIYQGANADAARSDEQESARLAAERLTPFEDAHMLTGGTTRMVSDFILATAPGARTESTPEALALLLDADLSIFAAPPHRYAEYAASVRQEYAHMPQAAFTAGRAAILASYLERARIYRTETAHALWEARARHNVAAELAALRAVASSDAT